METKGVVRRVRTLAGKKRYGQEIGTVIVRDVIPDSPFGPLSKKQYGDLLFSWETFTGAKYLKTQMREYLAYRGLAPQLEGASPLSPHVELSGERPHLGFTFKQLSELLNNAPRKRVYRGMRLLQGTFDRMVDNGYFDEPLGSCTTRQSLARDFARGEYGLAHAGEVPVMFVLDDAPAHRIDQTELVDVVVGRMNVSESKEEYTRLARKYDEHLISGRFKIERIDTKSIKTTFRFSEFDIFGEVLTEEFKVVHCSYVGPLEPITEGKAANMIRYNPEFDLEADDEPTTAAFANGKRSKVEDKARHVRTPAGAERFGQPIGSVIVRDVVPDAVERFGGFTRRQYSDLITTWQSMAGSSELKKQMREYLKFGGAPNPYPFRAVGHDLNNYRPWKPAPRRDLSFTLPELKSMIDNSPRKDVWRGMRISTTKFNKMVRNGIFDEPIGSCTTNEELGVRFAIGVYSGIGQRDRGLLLRLKGAPAHRFDLAALTEETFKYMNTHGESPQHFYEESKSFDEHLTAGRFKITSVEDDFGVMVNMWGQMLKIPFKRVTAEYMGPLEPQYNGPTEAKAAKDSFPYNEDYDIDEGDEPTTLIYLSNLILEGQTRTQEGESMEDKGVRHVRTEAGVRKYGQPIGAVIVKDVVDAAIKLFEKIKVEGRVNGEGTEDDPIDCGNDLDLAVDMIAIGKHVRLHQPDEVTIVLSKLADRVHAAERKLKKGEKPPNYNLCLISIPNTNLFCHGNKGISRIQMPQLSGEAIPGSPAEKLPQRGHGTGEVMGEKAFRAALEAAGIKVTDGRKKASHLRATQNELVGANVAGIADVMRHGSNPELDAPIFITRDNYIVDGHHRWAARVAVDADNGVLGDEEMDVEIIDADIGAILDFANAFANLIGIKQKSGTARLPQAALVAEAKEILAYLQTKVVEADMEPDPRETVDSEFLKEVFAALPESEEIGEVEMKWLFDTIPVYIMDMEVEAKVGPQSPDPRAARLRRYWSVGVGGTTKIKWGVPGDGKRCIRHLSKYLGPRAAGYCQNLHQQMVGMRVMGQGPGEKDMLFEDDEIETKKKFSTERREELAKEGEALPGGSYPIENEQDLKNAIHAYGRSKPEDRAKVRAHIIKRAKELGLERLIPEGWSEEKGLLIDLESKDIQEALDGELPFDEVEPEVSEEVAPPDTSGSSVVNRLDQLRRR